MGNTQSCGCLLKENLQRGIGNNKKDIANQKFGKLLALYPTKERRYGAIVWHCLCNCGNECDVSQDYLARGSTRSCGCLGASYGEYRILQLLEQNNIPYEQEKIFDDCINLETNRHYRYGFYLPDINRLIEFDGEQYYRASSSGWNTIDQLKKTQQRDKAKNEYAKEHKIDLVRIPYTEIDNLSIDLLLSNKYLIS